MGSLSSSFEFTSPPRRRASSADLPVILSSPEPPRPGNRSRSRSMFEGPFYGYLRKMTLYGFQSERRNTEELLRGAPTCFGIVRLYFQPKCRKNANWVCRAPYFELRLPPPQNQMFIFDGVVCSTIVA